MTPLYLATCKRSLQPGVRLFKYNSYWHSWSRILSPYGVSEPGTMVEVDCWDRNGRNVDRYKLANIRVHATPYSDSDNFMTELPTEVLQEMIKAYGLDDFERILDPDLLYKIDLQAAKYKSNGGTPLHKCRRLEPEP